MKKLSIFCSLLFALRSWLLALCSWLFALCSLLFANPLFAQPIELIDIPTAEVIEANHYGANFRIYKHGGIVSHFLFGIGKRVNLGISVDVTNFIGIETINLKEPKFQIKFRFYDGTLKVPAFALGYDTQGYHYYMENNEEKYLYPQKGLYLVATREIFPQTELHLGLNIYDFKEQQFRAFLGFSWTITEQFSFLLETDGIYKLEGDKWVNTGFRYQHTPQLALELSLRDLTDNKKIGSERILKVNYKGKF